MFKKGLFKGGPGDPGKAPSDKEKFWDSVAELCVDHVHRNVGSLRAGSWPHMDWAETRLNPAGSPSTSGAGRSQGACPAGQVGEPR